MFLHSYDPLRSQMDAGYPRYITWDFPGIGSKVDAVFENYGEKHLVTQSSLDVSRVFAV